MTDGPLFRAKRMALDLAVWELELSRREACRLSVLEDGFKKGPWDRYWPVLWSKFEDRVRSHVLAGGDWRDLRLNPWTAAEIRTAARKVR